MSARIQPIVTGSPAADVRAGTGISSGSRALILILASKLLVLAAVWLAYSQLSFATAAYEDNTHFHAAGEDGFLTWLTTWDASHYLLLAEDGYQQGLHLSNAFAPLLPLLIRGVGAVTGDFVIAGLLVANAASVAASYLFFAIVRKHWGERIATRALILFLAFPTAFFTSMIYTESLFLLLSLATFYYLAESRPGRAALSAFLMPLTRWLGVLIVVPMALSLLARGSASLARRQHTSIRGELRSLRLDTRLLWALAPLAGAAAYLLFLHFETGDYLAHVDAAALYRSQWSLSNLWQPWQLIDTTFGQGLSLHGQLDSLIDRGFFVAFLASAPLVYRRMSLPVFAFYALMGVQPLLGSYMSYTRYLLPVFPLFIAWAYSLERRPVLLQGVVGLFVLMQMGAILGHTSARWVA